MYMAFDLLYREGLDLRARPLADRRWRLERAIEGRAHVLPVVLGQKAAQSRGATAASVR
jgi:ATP-dependent DNA ligase